MVSPVCPKQAHQPQPRGAGLLLNSRWLSEKDPAYSPESAVVFGRDPGIAAKALNPRYPKLK